MFARKRQETRRKNINNLVKAKREGQERHYRTRNGVHSPVTRTPHANRMMHFCEPLGEASPRVPEINQQDDE